MFIPDLWALWGICNIIIVVGYIVIKLFRRNANVKPIYNSDGKIINDRSPREPKP